MYVCIIHACIYVHMHIYIYACLYALTEYQLFSPVEVTVIKYAQPRNQTPIGANKKLTVKSKTAFLETIALIII